MFICPTTLSRHFGPHTHITPLLEELSSFSSIDLGEWFRLLHSMALIIRFILVLRGAAPEWCLKVHKRCTMPLAIWGSLLYSRNGEKKSNSPRDRAVPSDNVRAFGAPLPYRTLLFYACSIGGDILVHVSDTLAVL